MIDQITLPSKPKIVLEDGFTGVYEIDGLYPGYGHTLGNSLRRIILSSLQGSAITHVKISGVQHEFATISGIKEDAISIILNLKQVRLRVEGDETQTLVIKKKGEGVITAGDIEAPSQVEILNPDLELFTITDKSVDLEVELTAERGIGYVPKEVIHKDRLDVGSIAVDATFTPIRRVNYETENMRVEDRTDYNRLRMTIETDGSMTPREALEQSIEIMIHQLKAVIGFKEELELEDHSVSVSDEEEPVEEVDQSDFLKTRIESIDSLSSRTINALSDANIRTIGGLVNKSEEDVLALDGLGDKGLVEIKDILKENGMELK